MSATNPADEYEALVHAVDRLSRRFPSVPDEELVDLVADELASFDHVRIRAYVPVLVEGSVLRRLRARHQRPEGVERLLAS